ncbi:MAG: hypothetical protein A3A73_04170 [Omnitrophica bacterium RIFCSPLOWO2_01_FULL_50_24]|nr:MAG: hypothetical protein A3A73_04170 [Omnitrophica bacterium RIFCSPLOWO2_01_FULL_50_24]
MRKHSERSETIQKRDGGSGLLTKTEEHMVHTQVRRNSFAIDHMIKAIDLLINKEQCPWDANILLRLRTGLEIAIAENDTFRKVLWRHHQILEQVMPPQSTELDPSSFIIEQIRKRKFAFMAQSARA